METFGSKVTSCQNNSYLNGLPTRTDEKFEKPVRIVKETWLRVLRKFCSRFIYALISIDSKYLA